MDSMGNSYMEFGRAMILFDPPSPVPLKIHVSSAATTVVNSVPWQYYKLLTTSLKLCSLARLRGSPSPASSLACTCSNTHLQNWEQQPCTWPSCGLPQPWTLRDFPSSCHISGLLFVLWNPDLFFPLCSDKPYLPLQSAHKNLSLNLVSFTSPHSYLAWRIELASC